MEGMVCRRKASLIDAPSVGQWMVNFSVLLFIKVVGKFHVAKSFMKVAYRASFTIYWGWLVSSLHCSRHEVAEDAVCIVTT